MSIFRGASKGLFVNGVWHCDCSPRLLTVHRQTSKPGPNHGRWFRTCSKPPREQCKFFLWDDDAHARENSAVATSSQSNHKRPRSISGSLDKYRPIKVEDEDDLDEVLNHIDMPNKAAKTTDFSTPAAKRRSPLLETDHGNSATFHGLQTPQTDRRIRQDLINSRFPITGGSPFPSSAASEDDAHPAAAPYLTPRTSLNETPNSSQIKSVEDEELDNQVFDLLQKSNVRLPDHTQEELRALLTKHAKRTEGYKRGQDVIRLTAKAKDAKVTELTYRINTLEAELEAEKAMIEHLQWQARNQTSDFD